MASLTSLTDLSAGALAADQAALNATANNVANQNTAGYTREVVDFEPSDTVSISAEAQYGGAPTLTVSSQRSRVLEQSVQLATQAQSSSAAQSSVLDQVQNVFSITSSSTSSATTPIGTALDSFFSSLSSLSANPSAAPTQQAVIAAAGNLASAFNSAADQLSQIGASVSQQLTATAPLVNTLTQSIASLNKQIAAQDPNSDAGTLEDRRQNDLAQLSQFIGIDQITTNNNGIDLTTTGGATLVSGAQSFNISVAPTTTGVAVLSSTGTDISGGIEGGSIGGLLLAQSVDLPNALNGLNSLALNLGNAVNAQNAAGVTASGAVGGGLFSGPGTVNGEAASLTAVTSVSALASATAGEGSSGNTNAQALAALATATNPNNQTFSGVYAALLSSVGNAAADASTQNTGQQTTLTNATTQRDSYSAVSLDQEASNLTTYQRSYEAAAKLFQIVDSMMTSAINLGEQSTVS
jgi:flagellar hook-associated protein 1 FlgK